jgi:protein-tyrosine phosphatase
MLLFPAVATGLALAAPAHASSVTTVQSVSAVAAQAAPSTVSRIPRTAAWRPPTPASAEVIPFTSASMTKNANGTWTVSYAAPGVRSVAVYVATGDSGFARMPVSGHGPAGSVTITTSAARPQVNLVPDRGAPLVVAPRYLGLSGVLNARDLGGYRTAYGQWVKYAAVYRTAALTSTGSDQALLDSLGISTVYDLRTPAEIAATPDIVPAGANWVDLNVEGDSSASARARTVPDGLRPCCSLCSASTGIRS